MSSSRSRAAKEAAVSAVFTKTIVCSKGGGGLCKEGVAESLGFVEVDRMAVAIRRILAGESSGSVT